MFQFQFQLMLVLLRYMVLVTPSVRYPNRQFTFNPTVELMTCFGYRPSIGYYYSSYSYESLLRTYLTYLLFLQSALPAGVER